MANTSKPKAPRVSVLERRIQNPFGESSGTIEFKREWAHVTARWFNDQITGQAYRARKSLGWLNVTPDMIADRDSIGAHDINVENKIVRGERGQEVLMWMPTEDFKRIQLAKTRVNMELMRDTSKQSRQMLEAMGKALGDEAATTAEAAVKRHIQTTDSYERLQRTPEAE